MTCDVRLGRILGLPCVWGEKVVGHVEGAVLDATGQRVEGFILRRGLGSAKWADRTAVSVLGDVSLVLKECRQRRNGDDDCSALCLYLPTRNRGRREV